MNLKIKIPQEIISSVPPIGVTKPIFLKSKEVNALVANPYMEPENKIIPITTR